MMTSSSKPFLRPERQGFASRKAAAAPDLTFSKSLGDYNASSLSFLQRYVSNVSCISHSGYLLKRSNRPLQPQPVHTAPAATMTTTTTSPSFPMTMDTSVPRVVTAERSVHQMPPRLQPKCSFGAYDDDNVVAFGLHESLPAADLPLQPPQVSLERTTMIVETEKQIAAVTEPSPLSDSSAAFASVFFGLNWSSPPAPVKETIVVAAAAPPQPEVLPDTNLTPTRKSAPIKVGGGGADSSDANLVSSQETQTVFSDASEIDNAFTAAHRSQSTISGSQQPTDMVDPVDGHVWRVKYCVMEEGTLFFYRNQSDAELPQALGERQEADDEDATQDNTRSMQLLAQSPIPTTLRDRVAQHVWEKRVSLDAVGAVRSAEMEYGKHSFELCAADETDDEKLVLRASDAEEMSEWLFQFHRAISSFVFNMVEQYGQPLRSSGDLHHPNFYLPPPSTISATNMLLSPARSPATLAFSPRFSHPQQQLSGSVTPSLSHGHGRSSHHRRRAVEDNHEDDDEDESSPSYLGPPKMPLAIPPTTRQSYPRPPLQSSPDLPIVGGNNPDNRRESSPEFSAPQSHYPEMERPLPTKPTKYIPPHLRNKAKYVPPSLRQEATPKSKYVPPHLRQGGSRATPSRPPPEEGDTLLSQEQPFDSLHMMQNNESDDEMQMAFGDADMETGIGSGSGNSSSDKKKRGNEAVKLGGCADPSVVVGSIFDHVYIPRKASRLRKVHTNPFGRYSSNTSQLQWEIGAVSECGVRDSNEDSYLIASDLLDAFGQLDQGGSFKETVWDDAGDHRPGLFAVFDGHCGDHAARFAAERLPRFIWDESVERMEATNNNTGDSGTNEIEQVLRQAIMKLDTAFCDMCVEGGREWDSGATALVAALVNEHLVIANLGDARGIMSRSVDNAENVSLFKTDGWNELPSEDYNESRRCLWKEVTKAHSPNREDERNRIHNACGWVTTETEIPIGQLQRMHLFDEDVIDILTRCFADRDQSGSASPKASAPQRMLQIARVCGELAVSRALGDRDFKASFNHPSQSACWEGPAMLPYPDDHNRSFVGDLVTSVPEFEAVRVGQPGVSDEFLLLACDGLWDVMDSDDAVRVARALLFEKGVTAKQAAARLAELAIHLGSSDNITVIVVRFLDRHARV